jgi:hypothetical protein
MDRGMLTVIAAVVLLGTIGCSMSAPRSAAAPMIFRPPRGAYMSTLKPGRTAAAPSFTLVRHAPVRAALVRLPRFLAVAPMTMVRGPQGQMMSARDLNPDDEYELRNGNRVRLQQYLDALDKLDESTPGGLQSIKRVPRMRVVNPGSSRRFSMNRTAAATHSFQIRQASRTPLPMGVVTPSGLAIPSRRPPASLSHAWQYGDPATFGVEFGLSVHDTIASGTAVGCAASVDLEVLVLQQRFRALRVIADAHGDSTGGHASLSIEAAGLGVELVSTAGGLSKSHKIETKPHVSLTVPLWGPLGIELEGWAEGEVGVAGSVEFLNVHGRPRCVVRVNPHGHVGARARAHPGIAGAGFLADILLSIVDVGIAAELDLVKVDVPLSTELSMRPQPPLVVDENISARIMGRLMSGRIYAYLDVPDILGIFGLDGMFEVELVAWPGEVLQEDLLAMRQAISIGGVDSFGGAATLASTWSWSMSPPVKPIGIGDLDWMWESSSAQH